MSLFVSSSSPVLLLCSDSLLLLLLLLLLWPLEPARDIASFLGDLPGLSLIGDLVATNDLFNGDLISFLWLDLLLSNSLALCIDDLELICLLTSLYFHLLEPAITLDLELGVGLLRLNGLLVRGLSCLCDVLFVSLQLLLLVERSSRLSVTLCRGDRSCDLDLLLRLSSTDITAGCLANSFSLLSILDLLDILVLSVGFSACEASLLVEWQLLVVETFLYCGWLKTKHHINHTTYNIITCYTI